MQAEAEITNVGPIERITIPIPEGGGVCVLRGRNGAGKSVALGAIDSAITGKGRPPVRDGQTRAEVSAFGVKLTIGRSTRRTGEAVVTSLEGKFPVAALVDPGIADPEKADAHRIRALVQLAGCEADVHLFHPLLPSVDEFEELVSPAAIEADDLLVMAARIKRDLEAAARKAADEAANAASRSAAARKAAEGIDLAGETDGATLQAALESAIARKASLESKARSAKQSAVDRERSAAALAKAKSDYSGPSAATAKEAEEIARNGVAKATKREADAKAAYEQCVRDRHDAVNLLERRVDAWERAVAHERTIAGWEDTLSKSQSAVSVPESMLAAAAAAVTAARVASDNGAVARRAK